MSGGSMDYICFRIDEAAEYIKETLMRYLSIREKGADIKYFKASEHIKEQYPDEYCLGSPERILEAVISELDACYVIMKVAAICAKHVEWLTSYDDSEDSFLMHLREAKKEFYEKNRVIEECLADLKSEQSQTNNKE